MKPAECLNNPLDPIFIPKSTTGAVDAEVELAIVVGRDCKDVDIDSALDYVLGYTTANDITCRDVQGQTTQWGYCKGYDGFCPLGPALVSAKAFSDPLSLSMRTTLDGKVLQDGTTDDMIFSVAEIISYLSKVRIRYKCHILC
jgi:2-keto-4-pentenoate hydratase/2-oxohepta-3-ene-1,7-dioic acid hydratase in catechol pathway